MSDAGETLMAIFEEIGDTSPEAKAALDLLFGIKVHQEGGLLGGLVLSQPKASHAPAARHQVEAGVWEREWNWGWGLPAVWIQICAGPAVGEPLERLLLLLL